jgi:TetR/AcrR family transcriptional regulator, copper-responsive repressor
MPSSTKSSPTVPKRPGRPRAYESELALKQITEAFWRTGFSGTSLDDLVAATSMNRPSLYAAFGDKKATYVKALTEYGKQGQCNLEGALSPSNFKEALLNTYRASISFYLGKDRLARGCFLISTAAAEAETDLEIRLILLAGIRNVDQRFEARIRRAMDDNELPKTIDAALLAQLATAVLHTLAMRARAGTSRAKLEAIARAGVALVTGERTM